MKARIGPPKAITATAHKLARLVYFALRNGSDYVDKGIQWYDQQFRERWTSPALHYIAVEKPQVERLKNLVGRDALHVVAESGGKFVFSNLEIPHRPQQ